MKLFLALITIVVGLAPLARAVDDPTNAYLIEFLDRTGKPLAKAKVLSNQFEKANKKPYDAACQIELLENKGEGEEVKWFKRLLPEGGVDNVQIETRSADDFGGGPNHEGAHVIIDFTPGTSDANIFVALRLNPKGPEGNWHYAIAAGGFEGGKVLVSRVAASPDTKKPQK